MINTHMDALLIGGPKPFRADGDKSSMRRDVVDHEVMLRREGFDGDKVADPSVHGGPDKAVNVYCTEHYPYWTTMLGGHALLNSPGAFGENITAPNLTEDRVKIGDRFRIGSAVVEVSQGRQPCWKIDHNFGVRGVTAAVAQTRRSGFYFRVLEEGEVSPQDRIEQIYTAEHQWTVERAFHYLVAGGHKDAEAPTALAALAQLAPLAENWKDRAIRLMA